MSLNNRKYDIRGILRDVKQREKEERKVLKLIDKLCINDLKDGTIDTIREAIRPIHITICEMHDREQKESEIYGS